MYSEDPIVEKTLSEIEGYAKQIIDKILKTGKTIPKSDEYYAALLLFILYQSNRTLFSINQLNSSIDKLSKSLLTEQIKRTNPEGITVDDLEKIVVRHSEPGLYSVSLMAMILPLVFDLDYKLIHNLSSVSFITSDNPVICYNKYYIDDFHSYTGYANKGLIMFFPLNPQYALIFYDSIIYKIGGQKLSSTITTHNENDINELNILQLINANKTLYPYRMNSNYIQRLHQIGEKYRVDNDCKILEGKYFHNSEGKELKVTGISKAKIKYNLKLSFLKIDKKIPDAYLKQKLFRNPKLVSLHKVFSQKVENGELKPSDWNDFIRNS